MEFRNFIESHNLSKSSIQMYSEDFEYFFLGAIKNLLPD